jgi:hypothetical protein
LYHCRDTSAERHTRTHKFAEQRGQYRSYHAVTQCQNRRSIRPGVYSKERYLMAICNTSTTPCIAPLKSVMPQADTTKQACQLVRSLLLHKRHTSIKSAGVCERMAMLLRIRQGDYGPVRVIEGEYAGRIGYYDADEGSLAVAYFMAPHISDAVLMRRSWLRPTNVIPLALSTGSLPPVQCGKTL